MLGRTKRKKKTRKAVVKLFCVSCKHNDCSYNFVRRNVFFFCATDFLSFKVFKLVNSFISGVSLILVASQVNVLSMKTSN